MGKKGGGWFSLVKKVFKQSPNKDLPEKKVSSLINVLNFSMVCGLTFCSYHI